MDGNWNWVIGRLNTHLWLEKNGDVTACYHRDVTIFQRPDRKGQPASRILTSNEGAVVYIYICGHEDNRFYIVYKYLT
jgi:hypothetical protein